MKRIIIYTFAALLLVSCTGIKARKADARLEELRTELNAVGLSVAVIKNNQIIYTGATGYKNLETEEPLQVSDLMRIASISKSFTATAIMQLHEAECFNLDDDISCALGFPVRNPAFPDIPITYRMLLSHTSSLSDKGGYFSLDVINPAVKKDVSGSFNDYAPGAEYEYCNLGFNMLGTLVEIHSGERFDLYIKNNILDPLGLTASFNVNDLDAEQFAVIYEYEEGEFVPSPQAYNPRTQEIEKYKMGYSTPIFSPTGGMKISAPDLAKHALVQMNDGTWNGVEILTPESVALMQTPQSLGDRRSADPAAMQVAEAQEGIAEEADEEAAEEPAGIAEKPESPALGYGFALEKTDRLIDGYVMTGHTGSAYGLYSAMFFQKEKKFGFIVLCNGFDTTLPRRDNGFMAVQTDVINAMYEIFMRRMK
ncbi:MAG: serine hydrolase domain-containing protein [Bacteroidales bacterium]|jgi:CubicO group peptidase (beta-lactamase class C family)